MTPVPISIREASEFVTQFHRHSKRPQGARFAIGVTKEGQLWAVAIVGRPVSRMLDDGLPAEVVRLCTRPGAPRNACSYLYGRAWRIWQAMGGKRMITYTLQAESGASLRGAGWKMIGEVKPSNGWSRTGRAREWQPVYGQAKFRWEAAE